MAAKKIGKAKANSEIGLWIVEGKSERFLMNQRLVELRPDVKALKADYSRHVHTRPPSKKQIKERAEYQQQQKDLKTEMGRHLVHVYAEILKESFSYPVPLRKDRDTDHRSDWRYCLYQGIIYRFDRPDHGSDEMTQQINALKNSSANSSQCQK